MATITPTSDQTQTPNYTAFKIGDVVMGAPATPTSSVGTIVGINIGNDPTMVRVRFTADGSEVDAPSSQLVLIGASGGVR